MLKVDSLTKTYSNGRGAKNISFALASGEVLGLLGPNGSGKTTTMKVIAGILRMTSGHVSLNGKDVTQWHEDTAAKMGCLIESPALYDHMTAMQNLKLAARFYDYVSEERVEEVLRLVKMEQHAKEKVGMFSLGMRQRLGLAIALLSHPELLILDEPANGLDIEGMVHVRKLIVEAAGNGAAVLISSHLANEIEQCATKVAIMHHGRLLCIESMDMVLSQSPTLEDFYLAQVSKMQEGVA